MPDTDIPPSSDLPASVEVIDEVVISERESAVETAKDSMKPVDTLIPAPLVEKRRYHMRKRIGELMEDSFIDEIMGMHMAEYYPLLSGERVHEAFVQLALELHAFMEEGYMDEEKVKAYLSAIDPVKALRDAKLYAKIREIATYLREKDVVDDIRAEVWCETLNLPKTLREVKKFRVLYERIAKLLADEKIAEDLANHLLSCPKPFAAYRSLTAYESVYDDVEKLYQEGNISDDYVQLMLNDHCPERARLDLDKYMQALATLKNNRREISSFERFRKDCLGDDYQSLDEQIFVLDGLAAKRYADAAVYIARTITELKRTKSISISEIREIMSCRDMLLADLKTRLLASERLET